MSKLAQFPLLVLAVAFTTAATPWLPPVQPVMTLVPVAIIDGGTVSTVPKGVRRSGKVVIVRGRGDKVLTAPAAPRKPAAPVSRGTERRVVREAVVVSGGGSSGDVVELRNTENGLRVMIIGPAGLTRTRYVPAAPGTTARHNQDD